MNQETILKRIGYVRDEVEKLNKTLYVMETTNAERYPDSYGAYSMEANRYVEKMVCQLRNLLYASTDIRKEDYLATAAETYGIEICYEDGIFTVKLVCLLPKRNQCRNPDPILDPLYYALLRYIERNPLPKFNECVVCFSHIYDRETPKSWVRDYDNIQYKQVLDIISTFILVDDSGLLCDAYHTTKIGEKNSTEVSVMEKGCFTKWLESKQHGTKNMSDF